MTQHSLEAGIVAFLRGKFLFNQPIDFPWVDAEFLPNLLHTLNCSRSK